MENDRREDPQPEAVSSQPEAPAYREAEERREDYGREEQPREDYRESEPEGGQGGSDAPTFDAEGRQTEGGAPGSEQQPPSGPPGQGHQDRDRGGRGRGGRRGGRRMSQRERRQDRGRRRDHRPGFSGSHHGGGGGGGYQQHGGGQPSHRDQGSEPLRGDQPQPRPEGSGSILNDIRAEVERLREVLEGVLRDLEDVAEQLVKAEHEKDLSEAEIEQLREQLRRLHR